MMLHKALQQLHRSGQVTQPVKIQVADCKDNKIETKRNVGRPQKRNDSIKVAAQRAQIKSVAKVKG